MTRPPEVHLERSTATETRRARVDPMQPMCPDGRFRVGSLTKTFVANVVLQFAGEGILDPDGTVDGWLPGLFTDGDRIAVGELLNLTGGLLDYLRDPRALVRQPTTGQATPGNSGGVGRQEWCR
jgi:CubicO group peptidase (beta-lactamase class C family)